MDGARVTRTISLDSAGWERGMHVVPIGGGQCLVFSPTWHGDDTFAGVLAVGEPAILVAPNHYHHLALARFRERFPDARAVTSVGAAPRLRRQGHVGLGVTADVASQLPGSARLIELPHTKNGETLYSFEGEHGRTWLVCDAFFHVDRPITGLEGVLLRWLRTCPGLRVGRTYRWGAVADRARYLDWLTSFVREEAPHAVYFAHGEPIIGADVPDRLIEAAREGLA